MPRFVWRILFIVALTWALWKIVAHRDFTLALYIASGFCLGRAEREWMREHLARRKDNQG